MPHKVPKPEKKSPRISVMIPSYKRPDDLRNTLEHTLRQRYEDYEIVVIDDGTPDHTIRDTVADFPTVRYVRPPHNLGLIGARNFGARHCRGDFILNLDDDSWLEEEDALGQIVGFMEANPEVGIAALNIRLPDRDYSWSPAASVFPVRWYTGCGNACRRSLLPVIGDYVEEFYRQGEELDRTMRVVDAGSKVVAVPWIKVFHSESAVNRNRGRHLTFEAVNYLRRELIRAPLSLVPLGVLRAARFTLRHRKLIDFTLFKSELFGSRVPFVEFVRLRRKPVSIRTYLYCLKIGNLGENSTSSG